MHPAEGVSAGGPLRVNAALRLDRPPRARARCAHVNVSSSVQLGGPMPHAPARKARPTRAPRPAAPAHRAAPARADAHPEAHEQVRLALADHAMVERLARTFKALGDPT